MTARDRNTDVSIWKSGIILAALAAICTALVSFTHEVTTVRIAANEQAYLEQSLAPVLAGIPYTNNLSESTIVIDPPHQLPGDLPVTVYRVYSDNVPVAALFVVIARDGFTGPIKMLIGIDLSGNISRVHILQHRETPGLGDLIESSKSDWIQQFNKTSLTAPSRQNWSIKRDGGVFDQLTGASVTPRAVIKAIRETLIYFEGNQDFVFARDEPLAEEQAE